MAWIRRCQRGFQTRLLGERLTTPKRPPQNIATGRLLYRAFFRRTEAGETAHGRHLACLGGIRRWQRGLRTRRQGELPSPAERGAWNAFNGSLRPVRYTENEGGPYEWQSGKGKTMESK